MSEHGETGAPLPPSAGGATENLNALLVPSVSGPVPMRGLASIPLDSPQRFQLDLEQAPQVMATFRHVAHELRQLMDEVRQLGNVASAGPGRGQHQCGERDQPMGDQ